jgi:pantoate--beta-alanine ligase
MISISTIAEVRAWRRSVGRVGLVPTMGALHPGHASLVERARRESDAVAASVFVNPTQFGPGEDLERYPRDPDADHRLLERAGCDVVFTPTVAEIYPSGFETMVDAGAVARPLEGERRPGHFRGVATVVLKLLGIVQPDRAYFGQKDAQQLAVIWRMVRDLDVPVAVVACPTVREHDGLAMSSRNRYLGPEDRQAATVLYRALCAARDCWDAGERRADELRGAMRRVLDAEPRARTDYVSVAEPATFQELDVVEGQALLSIAAFVGPARLIDNLLVGA